MDTVQRDVRQDARQGVHQGVHRDAEGDVDVSERDRCDVSWMQYQRRSC